jgi:hypothetical protein
MYFAIQPRTNGVSSTGVYGGGFSDILSDIEGGSIYSS